MKLYIVILHYGKVEDTLECIKSLKNQKVSCKIKVVIVDNSPKKELKDNIKNILIGGIPIDYIPANKNLGFSKGVNIGIRKALADIEMTHVLILNNDTVCDENMLHRLVNLNADISGPVIKFDHQCNWMYDHGWKINWWTGRTKHIENSKLETQNSKINEKIDYISGCCMLVKRKVFETIGLFDEDYFFYFEDVDFCVRAKQKGYRIAVTENAMIYHKLGGSIGRWSQQAIAYNLWGNFLFINKRMGIRKITGYLYLLLLSLKIGLNRIKNKT